MNKRERERERERKKEGFMLGLRGEGGVFFFLSFWVCHVLDVRGEVMCHFTSTSTISYDGARGEGETKKG